MVVKCLWRAVNVEDARPPYNTIHLKIFYPGKMSQSDREKNLGNDSYLVILEGANHFSIADCLDPTISSSLLDFRATYSQEKYRSLIANIISNFINVSVREDKKAAKELDRILDPKDSAIALIERK